GDDKTLAVTRGYVFEGFGQENRRAIVHKALDLGINLFDLTIDSEKEAMGRILRDLRPSQEIVIQTRPEGMCYTYDPCNRQMAQFDLLKEEVGRICRMLGRDHVDIFNFAFAKEAMEADPEYLNKIGSNIERLKQEGLIRFASADTFSGEATLLAQFASGHFDSTFLNHNILRETANHAIIPSAAARGMAVFAREAFMKGRLFRFAAEAGIDDRAFVARCSIQWILSDPRIASTMVGVSNALQLESNCAAVDELDLIDEEQRALAAIRTTPGFQAALAPRPKATGN
ncbi:MAG: aldo/keto reductase, partial [Candidatus Sumerlaeota bacterium]|nr:aldo/keto reductase [Candidatus Sumerlaeota bacterium]